MDWRVGDCKSDYQILHRWLQLRMLTASSIFWINLPLCVPSLAGIYFFIHLNSEAGSIKERLRKADWTGITILTGSLISLLYGVTSGGVLHPWNSAAVIASIFVGLSGTVTFLLYEDFFAKKPMIPLRIFKNRSAAAAYVSAFVLGFVLWAMQYYLILYVRTSYLTSQAQNTDCGEHSSSLRNAILF